MAGTDKAPSRPCGSCPYRRDVASGVWSEIEYDKLPEYDQPLLEQPPGMFYCHQQDGHLCAGWVGCHDMEQNLGVRIAVAEGYLVGDDIEKVLDYVSPVPLFESGQEARDHGMAEYEQPSESARTIQKRLLKKGLVTYDLPDRA